MARERDVRFREICEITAVLSEIWGEILLRFASRTARYPVNSAQIAKVWHSRVTCAVSSGALLFPGLRMRFVVTVPFAPKSIGGVVDVTFGERFDMAVAENGVERIFAVRVRPNGNAAGFV